MTQPLEQLPIQPCYSQSVPNAVIPLGTLTVTVEGQAGDVIADLEQRFVPESSIRIAVPVVSTKPDIERLVEAMTPTGMGLTTFTIRPQGPQFNGFCVHKTMDELTYSPTAVPLQTKLPSTAIKRAIFHIFNWPDFHGPEAFVLRIGEPPLRGATVCGRIVLDVDGWRIEVIATDQTRRGIAALKQEGGYVLTHVGSIERVDGTEFSSRQLTDVYSALSHYFSFVLGCWTEPSLMVGFDGAGGRVFEHLGIGHSTPGRWDGSRSWFDEHHSEFFAPALAGFWKHWNTSIWRRALRGGIYWYMAANRAGMNGGVNVDSALLFAQSAFELLSWTYCVLDHRIATKKDFSPGGLSAAEKIRRLAKALKLPTGIPPRLTTLHANPLGKWNDSFDALTYLRNRLVHPGKNDRVPEGAYYEAWRLAMWYLELILLRICGHSGKYANRLAERSVGVVEDVP